MQIGLHWVKWMVPSGSLNCLGSDVDGDHDALSLQPFRSQAILVIGPFPLGNHAPGGGLEDDRSKPEFVNKCSAEHLSTNVKLSEMWS